MVQPLTVRVALTGSLTFFKGINETFFGSGMMLGRQRPFQWGLSLLFGPCRLSEFTLAGPQDILLTGQLVFAFNKLEDLLPHMANISVAKATTMSTISMFLTLYYKQTIGITDDV